MKSSTCWRCHHLDVRDALLQACHIHVLASCPGVLGGLELLLDLLKLFKILLDPVPSCVHCCLGLLCSLLYLSLQSSTRQTFQQAFELPCYLVETC